MGLVPETAGQLAGHLADPGVVLSEPGIQVVQPLVASPGMSTLLAVTGTVLPVSAAPRARTVQLAGSRA
ncbi:hypothetical protein [Streptomyces sp. AC550_RSS872]|uniref:hypothetical protein n=1 Tax=Streptomyces sp. AC550_RSS872 TaxID=2823689 RepID=UPI0020B79791|nr:hypothetical protein [Streptomyces sp. AC550_RSS872]